MVTNVYAIVVR